MKGFVKRIVRDKGFGFIRSSAGQDYFFHKSGLEDGSKTLDRLNETDPVTFEVVQSDKGPRAEQIRVGHLIELD